MNLLSEKWHQPIRCFQNVSEYNAIEGPDFCWNIRYESETYPLTTAAPIYFILDSSNHAAFSHWVYENATWLPYFLEIQQRYPSCRLVLKQMKTYKQLYADFYGVSRDCMVVAPPLEKENFCFFHSYTSLNDKAIPDIYHKNLLHYQKRLEILFEQKEKKIPLLYLPRGSKENFLGANNRTYDIQTDLKQHVLNMGGTVYETDTTTDLHTQIQLIQNAKIILLDYGSNLWVNGFFARNSKIICLNIGWNQHSQYPSLEILWKAIQETNTISQVFAYTSNEKNIEGISLVKIHISHVLQSISEALS